MLNQSVEDATLLEAHANSGVTARGGVAPARRRRLATGAFVFILLFLLVTGLQWSAGAFSAEFSGYPDEASHYLSGVLVHDYISAWFPAPPLKFAKEFYLRYPYVAIGHWPPLFYVLEAGWMLLFSCSRLSVILLSAVITTALAAGTYQALRRDFGPVAALACAAVLVMVPVVQKYAGMVMVDTLLAVLTFWAALCFGRYLDTGRWQDAARFGALACLAILTKGNAFYLVLVPPIAVLLTRRFGVLRRASFWLPVLMVLVVCVPWHLWTLHLMLPTFGESAGLEFVGRSLRFYSLLLVKYLGPAILALGAAGIVARILVPFARRQIEGEWAAMAALLLGIGVFYCTVPGGIEHRYLIAAMPPLFLFFAAGAEFLSRRAPISAIPSKWRLEAWILLAVLVFGLTSFTVPRKTSSGFHQAVQHLMSRPEFHNSLSLVSSETLSGEGVFVSEVAMAGRRDAHAILRASKSLADSDWNVKRYSPRYATAESLAECVEQIPIRFIVLDRSPGAAKFEHHRQLEAMVRNRSDHWRLLGVFGGDTAAAAGPVSVYGSTVRDDGPMPRGAPLAGITTNLNGTLRHWPITVQLTCRPAPREAPASQ